MSQKLYEEASIRDIASAIREQNGTQNSYTVAQMGSAVRAIRTQPIVQPLSVNRNGTYNPPSGVDGYAPVTVNVSGGTPSQNYAKDTSYLPNSNISNILVSSELDAMSSSPTEITVEDANFVPSRYSLKPNSPPGSYFYVDLSGANTDVTCYCVARRISGIQTVSELLFMTVPYALYTGNAPCFDFQNDAGRVDYAIFSSNTTIAADIGLSDHVYAMSLNAATKIARFFYDGTFLGQKSYGNSGSYVCWGRGAKDAANYDGYCHYRYLGAVNICESDENIIANMQTIMRKLGLTN